MNKILLIIISCLLGISMSNAEEERSIKEIEMDLLTPNQWEEYHIKNHSKKSKISLPSKEFINRGGKSCTKNCLNPKICKDGGYNDDFRWCKKNCAHKESYGVKWNFERLYKAVCEHKALKEEDQNELFDDDNSLNLRSASDDDDDKKNSLEEVKPHVRKPLPKIPSSSGNDNDVLEKGKHNAHKPLPKIPTSSRAKADPL